MKNGKFLLRLGDPESVAVELASLSGEPVTRHAMRNWDVRGIPRYLRPFAARLAEQKGVPLPKELKRYATPTASGDA